MRTPVRTLQARARAWTPPRQPTWRSALQVPESETYTIDAWGNLNGIGNNNPLLTLEPWSVVADDAHANKNQLAGDQYRGYAYDAAGNLTSDEHGHNYTYDPENRISTVDNGSAGYTYDGDPRQAGAGGQRIAKTLWGGEGTLYWYGLKGEILAESDLQGYIKSEYVYFNGKRLARTDDPNDPALAKVRYYLTDRLGSTTMVMDETFTTVLEDNDYYPYGGIAYQGGAGDDNHYRFNGKERDSETGNDYFGARYYASRIGRFMTPDWSAKAVTVPYANFANPQSLNLYSFVKNNPTTLGDPDGHIDCSGSSANGIGCRMLAMWASLRRVAHPLWVILV